MICDAIELLEAFSSSSFWFLSRSSTIRRQVDFAFSHQCVPDAEWTKKMSRLSVCLDCATIIAILKSLFFKIVTTFDKTC
jgi:hypothetical protein